MASTTIIQLTDDLDGSPATQTVKFSIAGTDYEIDLNDKNADKLNKALAPFVTNARTLSRRAATSRRRPTAKRAAPRTQDMRQWLRDAGHEVSDRGRISAELQKAYRAAH